MICYMFTITYWVFLPSYTDKTGIQFPYSCFGVCFFKMKTLYMHDDDIELSLINIKKLI